MDWQIELITAIFWLFKAFFWVVLSLSVCVYGLKFTSFGRKFWYITRPCLTAKNTAKALTMIGLLIFFVLLEVKISVLNTQFYNKLYSSLQDMNAQAFWFFALLNALSIGELQRVAFVRALLVKPAVIFLDETTSAVDEPTEFALYQLLKDSLPTAIIVSVGHRSTLMAFHSQRLILQSVM
ncbi:MAG: hypothetical protein Q4B79_03195 [Moraxella sp.]|uniref:ATP-binding cassette domain-containing protein n=1 Tax=Moraxella sp. TaxID=479 RepID=UPI0026DD75A3|nr:ATP-binding cassette domain-containing protein [Moraxella sp.]MDO4449949.1 hypothetical protein [Moraxella sp.]